MLKSHDVIWEKESSDGHDVTKGSHVNSIKPLKKKKEGRHSRRPNPALPGDAVRIKDIILSSDHVQSKFSPVKGISLKDLNPQDKQRIAHLIKELAKADEEKENIVQALENERLKFLHHVEELEKEKNVLLNRQQFLSEEVKQCQTLLQYYQNLISMQQARLISQGELENSVKDETSVDDQIKRENGWTPKSRKVSNDSDVVVMTMSSDELSSQFGATPVEEETAECTFSDEQILLMSERKYKKYLERKKLKLRKEQERLRKLLEIKVNDDENLSDFDSSPLPDAQNEANHKKSVTVQTYLSPERHHSQFNSPVVSAKNVSFYTPSHNKSQTNLSRSYESPSTLTSTLKRSSDQPISILNEVPIDSYGSPWCKSLNYIDENCSVKGQDNHSVISSLNEPSVVTDDFCCDDSQILQDVFFV